MVSFGMGAPVKAETPDSVVDILSRAFDAPGAKMPRATAELIMEAKLPDSDKEQVERLLEQKRDSGLNPDQAALLRDYLHVDCLLTILKSQARRVLAESAAA